jgi:hypothetical protein
MPRVSVRIIYLYCCGKVVLKWSVHAACTWKIMRISIETQLSNNKLIK